MHFEKAPQHKLLFQAGHMNGAYRFINYDLTVLEDAFRTSLVAQWLRICLPMQGTRVRALVREDPTCRGATKPVHHNY